MTTDATLHRDIRKMMQLIEALLTHGIRDSLDECALMMKKATDRMENYM